jgi:hypothetical protein
MRYTAAEIELTDLHPDRDLELESSYEGIYSSPPRQPAKRESTWGGKIGKLVAQLFFAVYALNATGMMAIFLLGTPGLAVFIPSLIIGLISAINAKPETGPLKGFLQGFIATSFISGTGLSLFLSGTSILFAANILSMEVVRAAFTSFALLVMPITLPVIALVSASHIASREHKNVTDTFWKKTMNIFYHAGVNMCVEIGYIYSELIKYSCRAATAFIFDDTSALEPSTPYIPTPSASPSYSNSSSVIMSTTGHIAGTVNLAATVNHNLLLTSQRQPAGYHRFYGLPPAAPVAPALQTVTTLNTAARF